jgi:hypothetical protein
METEKIYLFPGCALARNEDAMAACSINASVLESVGVVAVDGWLQQCYRLPGKDGAGTGADRAGTVRETIRGQA